MSFKEYSSLAGVGYGGKEQVAPEDEFFHNIYIPGSTRKNHIGVEEYAGKLQIRGVQYNLDAVYMIITQVKDMLVKNVSKQGRDSLECFSYKEPAEGPWFGTSKLPDGSQRPCGSTAAERATVDYCSPCRTQLVVAGILCKEDGEPILKDNEDGSKQAFFVFVRGKGVKFNGVSTYLAEISNEEFDPIFVPSTPESLEFEKKVVNNKRVVTKITIGKAKTQYGEKLVYNLSKGREISKDLTMQILNFTKKTMDKFNEKFDWSKGKLSSATSSYAGAGVLPMEAVKPNTTPIQETPKPEVKVETKPETPAQKKISFDDIKF